MTRFDGEYFGITSFIKTHKLENPAHKLYIKDRWLNKTDKEKIQSLINNEEPNNCYNVKTNKLISGKSVTVSYSEAWKEEKDQREAPLKAILEIVTEMNETLNYIANEINKK